MEVNNQLLVVASAMLANKTISLNDRSEHSNIVIPDPQRLGL